jgi:hypothetical protein
MKPSTCGLPQPMVSNCLCFVHYTYYTPGTILASNTNTCSSDIWSMYLAKVASVLVDFALVGMLSWSSRLQKFSVRNCLYKYVALPSVWTSIEAVASSESNK